MDIRDIIYEDENPISHENRLQTTKRSKAKISNCKPPKHKKEDSSSITFYKENPIIWEDQLQTTKHSKAKINNCEPPKPQKEGCVNVVRYIVHDASDFRSLVQRLTGRPSSVGSLSTTVEGDRGTVFDKYLEAYSKITSYDNMRDQCLRFLRRPLSFPYHDVPPECVGFLAYCTIFPKGYELEGDTLMQLRMAAGLISLEPMEDIGAAYLRALCDFEEILSFSREDYDTGKKWYKVNKLELSEERQGIIRASLLRLDSCHHKHGGSKKEVCHVMLQNFPSNHALEVLARSPKIRSVLLPRGQGSNIDSLPYDFFMSLKLLQVLDLSGTKVSELPSSIGNAKLLCYLDLSDTPIKRLPETLDSLQNLQTLKLQNCSRLLALPKGTRRLTSLRHLDLGEKNCRLRSMPPRIGELTCLRTLSNFIVGQESGCRIGELNNLNHLGGKLCLLRLEHVASLHEVREANLNHKQHLTKLELQWTDDRERENIVDYFECEVIGRLRPHTNLQDLRVLCYGGSTFPSWISSPCFNKIKSITLFKCENCQFLPALGQLPELISLSLIELNGVKLINFYFCRNVYSATVGDKLLAFPRLQKLVIKSMVNLRDWRDVGVHDFPQLSKLTIKDCPQLGALCRISDFSSLEYLEINCCGMLSRFPEGDLPKSLKTVVVESCPFFYSFGFRCLIEDAKSWHKMEHSPTLMTYQREEDQGEHTQMPPQSLSGQE